MIESLTSEASVTYKDSTTWDQRASFDGLEYLEKLLVVHHWPTFVHCQEVAGLAKEIVLEMRGRSQEYERIGWEQLIEDVSLVGRLHDIGKISVSKEILDKKGRLNTNEKSLINEHPELGFIMLEPIMPLRLATAVRQHHERFNGRGYPLRVKGEDILLEARVITVADVAASLLRGRPYQKGVCGWEVAWEEIKKYSGTRYDPRVSDAALRVLKNQNLGFFKRFDGEIGVTI